VARSAVERARRRTTNVRNGPQAAARGFRTSGNFFSTAFLRISKLELPADPYALAAAQ
jgi:hypothetical protein